MVWTQTLDEMIEQWDWATNSAFSRTGIVQYDAIQRIASRVFVSLRPEPAETRKEKGIDQELVPALFLTSPAAD